MLYTIIKQMQRQRDSTMMSVNIRNMANTERREHLICRETISDTS